MLQELLSNDGVDTGSTSVVDPCVVLGGGKTEEGVLGGWDQVLCWGKGVSGGSELNGEVCCWLGGEDSKTG